MYIERKYYTRALYKMSIPERPEKKKEVCRKLHLLKYALWGARNQVTIDAKKEKQFKEMAEAALAFAKSCDLDVRIWTDDMGKGNICFETSYFVLTEAEASVQRAFWQQLCKVGELMITMKKKVFSVHFQFGLQT